MAIRTIQAVVDIADDRRLVVQLPPDTPTGRHRVVAVLDEVSLVKTEAGVVSKPKSAEKGWRFLVLEGTAWPDGMEFHREDLYGDVL